LNDRDETPGLWVQQIRDYIEKPLRRDIPKKGLEVDDPKSDQWVFDDRISMRI
jgi:hypothetical protein